MEKVAPYLFDARYDFFETFFCAQMILESVEPAVDAGAVDSAGLTVLHRVSQALDLPYLALLLEERQKSQGELRPITSSKL